MANRKTKLLIADDDPEILSMLSRRFGKKGFEVFEASDGVEALRVAHAEQPDGVILDVMMPGKTGWEVTKALRADALLADVGIVMLTAIGERVNAMTSPLYGADEYIDKPFEFDKLEDALDRAIAARKKRP